MKTVYEHAGGEEALRLLEDLFYWKVVTDPVLKTVFTERRPHHVDHLTWFTAESFGGPDRFTRELGFQQIINVHRGLKITDQQRERFVALYLEASMKWAFPTTIDSERRCTLMWSLAHASRNRTRGPRPKRTRIASAGFPSGNGRRVPRGLPEHHVCSNIHHNRSGIVTTASQTNTPADSLANCGPNRLTGSSGTASRRTLPDWARFAPWDAARGKLPGTYTMRARRAACCCSRFTASTDTLREREVEAPMTTWLNPIGIIRSTLKTRANAPRQGRRERLMRGLK